MNIIDYESVPKKPIILLKKYIKFEKISAVQHA